MAQQQLECCIVWFRRDLRTYDNPALVAALNSAKHVIPVYVWAPEEEVRCLGLQPLISLLGSVAGSAQAVRGPMLRSLGWDGVLSMPSAGLAWRLRPAHGKHASRHSGSSTPTPCR